MRVVCTVAELGQAVDEGDVVVVTGTEEATGDRVTFGVDRMAYVVTCGGLLSGGGAVTFEVEGWQVLSRQPAGEER